jgi:transposase
VGWIFFGISRTHGGKDMRTAADYAKYRAAHRDGLTIRQLAHPFHVSRRTVREALAAPEPKPSTRTQPPPASVLGPFTVIIDQVLRDDRDAPPKQRHSAAQLFRRLQDKHGYPGSDPTVRRYIATHRQRSSPTFIPLAHPPGHRLEADFGHIHVDFPDGRRLVPVLVTVWAYSNAPFVLTLPTECTEAILHGMVRALEFFAAVPCEVWWDNPKTVATLILRGRQRHLHFRYAALASHYPFEATFCLPAQAREKLDVESGVRAVQRRFATPVPRVAGIAELN